MSNVTFRIDKTDFVDYKSVYKKIFQYVLIFGFIILVEIKRIRQLLRKFAKYLEQCILYLNKIKVTPRL